MIPINEKEVWDKQILQIEVGDKVLGGDDGPINQPLKSLTNRTAFLKALASAVIEKAGLELGRFDDVGLLAAAIEKIVSAGCAASAAKLTTPRLVGGVAFDGTADIHLPVSMGFNPKQLYQAGDLVKIDGEWYECYYPDGIKGKDPRDSLNRPAGWQTTDQSQPYYWLKIGRWLSFPEVGSPIYLPTTQIREGLIKYRNDGKLHKNKFWRLAELYPDLITNNFINIADLRAEFIRGLDDGRGLDVGRTVNSTQHYQIVDHTHSLEGWTGKGDSLISKTDSFRHNLGGIAVTQGDGGVVYSDKEGKLIGSLERMLGTRGVFSGIDSGSENRPRNVAMLIATRI